MTFQNSLTKQKISISSSNAEARVKKLKLVDTKSRKLNQRYHTERTTKELTI